MLFAHSFYLAQAANHFPIAQANIQATQVSSKFTSGMIPGSYFTDSRTNDNCYLIAPTYHEAAYSASEGTTNMADRNNAINQTSIISKENKSNLLDKSRAGEGSDQGEGIKDLQGDSSTTSSPSDSGVSSTEVGSISDKSLEDVKREKKQNSLHKITDNIVNS